MWRRPRPDPAAEAVWAGFLGFAGALDEGSRALLATVPSARRPGAPLEAGVAGFLAGLDAARAELPAWDHPALAGAQAAAAAALDAAERAARDLPAASDGLATDSSTSARSANAFSRFQARHTYSRPRAARARAWVGSAETANSAAAIAS